MSLQPLPAQPAVTRVLILALGGEGGSVLADWLVDALLAAGYPVQATSVPGVAQRTGATSYYIECLPQKSDATSIDPVFCLSPSAGQIDLLVSSELLETGRAVERGLVTPGQTTLISSTNRFLTVMEKMQMADGRYDDAQILEAAREMSRNAVLFDMNAATQAAGTVISSVMFGALAASARLPLTREQCEAVIHKGGRGIEASLRGFAAGFDAVAHQHAAPHAQKAPAATTSPSQATPVPAPVELKMEVPTLPPRVSVLGTPLPAEVAEVATLGVQRLTEYQDETYARQYLGYVGQFVAADEPGYNVSRTAARFLALWMSYEDVIRVADLKSRASRFERIRGEFGAATHEPVVVRDFLKPGVEEVAAVLPPSLARRLTVWAQRRGLRSFSDGIQLQTSSVTGLLLMRLLSSFRRWRRRSSRFIDEQALITRWVAALLVALARDRRLALEVAECPRLIKGYSDTFARGRRNFLDILGNVIEPGLGIGHGSPAASGVKGKDSNLTELSAKVRRAREAAMEDPEGRALAKSLGRPPPEPRAQPIRFLPMKRER